MEYPLCPECKLIPTHRTFKVCGQVVCPKCISDRVFDDLNDVRCKYCNQNPLQNPIYPDCFQLPMNHACRLCGIIVCYYCCQIIIVSENDM